LEEGFPHMKKLLLAVLTFCLSSMALMAQTPTPGPGFTPTPGLGSVPEIDPSSAVAALALLTGAGLIIRSRFKRK
jgi:hypothetical protein